MEARKLHFLIAYCNWIRILHRHKQCNQILVFIELLSDLVFIWNKKESVSQDLWHSKPWQIQCQCQHTNLLVYKIWHSLIYSQRGQIRYFFTYQKYLWVFLCCSICRMQRGKAALQFSRQQLAEENKWLHRVPAIEMPSVCDIKNNWTNRDKGQIGFKTAFFFLRRKKNECASETYICPQWVYWEGLHSVCVFNWSITGVPLEPKGSILNNSLWVKNDNDESGEKQSHQHNFSHDVNLQFYCLTQGIMHRHGFLKDNWWWQCFYLKKVFLLCEI